MEGSHKPKSLDDISMQRDRLKLINRDNITRNPKVSDRADTINRAASNARASRKLSIFHPDRKIKK